MIKIENIETYGFKEAIRGMRNPFNSWNDSDSYEILGAKQIPQLYIGEKDMNLMKKLSAAGTDHGKYMRNIIMMCDITAPLYWWKEFDTYKVGTVANSCSTMHKIHAKEFTLSDFSCEHMDDKFHDEDGNFDVVYYEEYLNTPRDMMNFIIKALNKYRKNFLITKNKRYWWYMIQLLPTSYNQKRTVQMNYAVLKHMYHSRLNHKLDEWRDFCRMIETLPYSEIITLKSEEKNDENEI